MAFANASVTDIIATTIESRTGKIADNVTLNNALFYYLDKKGHIKEFSGGSQIFQELSFGQNGNAAWYSGNDLMSVSSSDNLSAAAYPIKQLACPVVITGLELLQNSGKEQFIDLMEERLKVAENTLANIMAQAVYSDGTGFGGKQLTGLQLAVSLTPTAGSYGGIDPSTTVGSFWANQLLANGAQTAATIQASWNQMWASLVRGKDRPKLIVADNSLWTVYVNSLQALQRFTNGEDGNLGFPTVKFMDADVVLDGGIGGYIPTTPNPLAYFLNTDYLFLRPHKDRNMVPLTPNRRVAVNQDAEVEIIAWAGNLTCSGRRFQGVHKAY